MPVLKRLAATAPTARTRMHTLWTLDGLDASDPADVIRALDDRDRDVRTAAVRMSERWLGAANNQVGPALLRRLDDSDWSVRRQLAATLGELGPAQKAGPMATLLERHGDDPIIVDAALSGLRGEEATVFDLLVRSEVQTPQRASALTMLAAAIVRSGEEATIQKVFDAISARETRPQWQRAALLLGTEVATLGAQPTPSPARGRGAGAANAPCDTCPGGRGGPGGARAFETGVDGPSAVFFASNPAPAPVTVTLRREPALTQLTSSGSSDSGPRVVKVLDKVAWPGKALAAAPAIPPLNAVEQERLVAGNRIYEAQCEACHNQDGRGLPGLGSSLTGAAFVTGPAAIAARILLNGKEGPVGLMPPLGGTMSDDDLAAVLTYIRRAWGNTGTPVDRALVEGARAETAARTRPWTNDELSALAGGAP